MFFNFLKFLTSKSLADCQLGVCYALCCHIFHEQMWTWRIVGCSNKRTDKLYRSRKKKAFIACKTCEILRMFFFKTIQVW